AITFVPGNLTIGKDPTTTAAAASATQVNFGQPLTFTATVTANAPGSGTPTGSVDFFDTTTATDLGMVALTGGQAALSTTALASGSHTITLTYGGGGNYLGSFGTVVVSVLP